MTDPTMESKERESLGIARFLFVTTKDLAKFAVIGLVSASIVLIVLFVLYLEKRPDLNRWHKTILDEEFTAKSPVETYEEYLALEERLFEQLEEEVCQQLQPEDKGQLNRFHHGSLSDPNRWPRNWNRTFEIETEDPRGGVLLLHGMSDSPYSLRSISERLQSEGYWVVGLRLPGHGTAPSGLAHIKWEDMAAVVRIGMNRLKEKVGDRPLVIVGYSNGGALGVHYALSGLEDKSLPELSALVLISPAIGVAPVAALAVWQARLGHALGLAKLEWSAIGPEYDPFKFNSFAVNAGDQVYRLTKEIWRRLEDLKGTEEIKRIPPILAFQSAVDGTVSTRALVEHLFVRLSPGGHELVAFDVNRLAELERLLAKDPKDGIDTVLQNGNLPFSFSLITNQTDDKTKVGVLHINENSTDVVESSLELSWPEKVYSLSHVALPFSMDDPLYGAQPADANPGIFLGNMALRGERGLLQIGAAEMLRLRHNPFYEYMEQRLLDFLTSAGS